MLRRRFSSPESFSATMGSTRPGKRRQGPSPPAVADGWWKANSPSSGGDCPSRGRMRISTSSASDSFDPPNSRLLAALIESSSCEAVESLELLSTGAATCRVRRNCGLRQKAAPSGSDPPVHQPANAPDDAGPLLPRCQPANAGTASTSNSRSPAKASRKPSGPSYAPPQSASTVKSPAGRSSDSEAQSVVGPSAADAGSFGGRTISWNTTSARPLFGPAAVKHRRRRPWVDVENAVAERRRFGAR
mmetsp:Transcript_11518/g.29506  ORF Transcript_11518/g.29506 Transcript_11518/m.29506 type:complete len:246 (+) Transcript_11518:2272-3009(+)